MTHPATLCLEHPVHRPLNALRWLHAAYRIYRQRRALLALDAAMLKDLGISRADALREGGKPFWQP